MKVATHSDVAINSAEVQGVLKRSILHTLK